MRQSTMGPRWLCGGGQCQARRFLDCRLPDACLPSISADARMVQEGLLECGVDSRNALRRRGNVGVVQEGEQRFAGPQFGCSSVQNRVCCQRVQRRHKGVPRSPPLALHYARPSVSSHASKHGTCSVPGCARDIAEGHVPASRSKGNRNDTAC